MQPLTEPRGRGIGAGRPDLVVDGPCSTDHGVAEHMEVGCV